METISRAEKYLEEARRVARHSVRPLTNFNPIFSSRRSAFRPSCARQLAQQPLSASVNILLPAYTAATAAVSCLLSRGQAVAQVSACRVFSVLTILYSVLKQSGSTHVCLMYPSLIILPLNIVHWRTTQSELTFFERIAIGEINFLSRTRTNETT